jgi:DNA-binding MarR family transcriptional regulator
LILPEGDFRVRMKRGSKKKHSVDADYQALAQFRYHIRRYLEFSDQAAKTRGIEPRQYQLLLAIRGLPGDREPTIGLLAEHLGLRHHSAVELVDRAETNNLVLRKRIGTRVHVRVTRKGQRVLTRAMEDRLPELRAAAPILVKALQQLTTTATGRRKG